jgi:major membrane immunogen (membrane-anchored lipoprotein)
MTLADQIKCVRRELALRKSAYPHWVKDGRMKQEDADYEIEAMQAVHDTLTKLVEGRDLAEPS